jgi:hypothetical protein
MAAASSSAGCALTVLGQVTGPIFAVVNIVSLGTAKGATAAAQQGIKGANKAAGYTAKAVAAAKKAATAIKASKAGKMFKKGWDKSKAARDAYKTISHYGNAGNDIIKAGKSASESDAERDIAIVRATLELAGVVDPTGLADVAAAYTHPMCHDLAGATF